jgi:hypothetical protein
MKLRVFTFSVLQTISLLNVISSITIFMPAENIKFKEKKVNVYLSSLMMKVPDHVYVLG